MYALLIAASLAAPAAPAPQPAPVPVPVPVMQFEMEVLMPSLQLALENVDRTLRPVAPFRQAVKLLGPDKVCKAYLKAWRDAYPTHFGEVRKSFYDAMAKVYTSRELVSASVTSERPALRERMRLVMQEWERNGGTLALKRLSIAVANNTIDAANAAAAAGARPFSDDDTSKLLSGQGVLCDVSQEYIKVGQD